jgi:aquaglyceroporin related protein
MSDEKKSSAPSNHAISHDEHAKRPNPEGSSSDSEHKPYEEHGPGIDHHIPQDEVVQAEPQLWWSKTRHMIREPLAEFFGVFILILFGDG